MNRERDPLGGGGRVSGGHSAGGRTTHTPPVGEGAWYGPQRRRTGEEGTGGCREELRSRPTDGRDNGP